MTKPAGKILNNGLCAALGGFSLFLPIQVSVSVRSSVRPPLLCDSFFLPSFPSFVLTFQTIIVILLSAPPLTRSRPPPHPLLVCPPPGRIMTMSLRITISATSAPRGDQITRSSTNESRSFLRVPRFDTRSASRCIAWISSCNP